MGKETLKEQNRFQRSEEWRGQIPFSSMLRVVSRGVPRSKFWKNQSGTVETMRGRSRESTRRLMKKSRAEMMADRVGHYGGRRKGAGWRDP